MSAVQEASAKLTKWRLERAEDAVIAAITRGDANLYSMASVLVRHLRECVAEDCGVVLPTLRHDR